MDSVEVNIKRTIKEMENVADEYLKKISDIADQVSKLHKVLYMVDYVQTEKPKCKKCNFKREIKYISPMGKEISETCDCSKLVNRYFSKELVMIDCRYTRKDTDAVLKYMSDDGRITEIMLSEITSNLYDGSSHNGYIGKFFTDKVKCASACTLLNIDLS